MLEACLGKSPALHQIRFFFYFAYQLFHSTIQGGGGGETGNRYFDDINFKVRFAIKTCFYGTHYFVGKFEHPVDKFLQMDNIANYSFLCFAKFCKTEIC